MGWILMFIVTWALVSLGMTWVVTSIGRNKKEAEHNRQVMLRHEKLWRYMENLHIFGVGSRKVENLKIALTYKDGGEDTTFKHRAEVLEDLFRMKNRIWKGHA